MNADLRDFCIMGLAAMWVTASCEATGPIYSTGNVDVRDEGEVGSDLDVAQEPDTEDDSFESDAGCIEVQLYAESTGGAQESAVTAQVGTRVQLGLGSSVPMDSLSVAWKVLSRPASSDASVGFEPSPASPRPLWFLDAPGEYAFSAQVSPTEGNQAACEVAPVQVEALTSASPELSIELTWGGGANLGLHLINARGRWDSPPNDCFIGNPNPNWGAPALTDDDPQWSEFEEGSDVREQVILVQATGTPTNPMRYVVGVYCAESLAGSVQARVRVVRRGGEPLEWTKIALAPGQFWEMVAIRWPEGDTEDLDIIHEGFP